MQPHLPNYRSSIARTPQDVDAVQRLRFVSIGTDLKIRIAFDPRVGREVSGFDNLSTSYNLLLHSGHTLVGTARLALPNPEVARASGTDFGFEIEDNLVARSGIPRIESAVKFLRGHGDADRYHIEALAAAFEHVTDPDEMALVRLSARVTATLYFSLFDIQMDKYGRRDRSIS